MEKKPGKGIQHKEVTLSNLKKVASSENVVKADVSSKKGKKQHPFTLNIAESSNDKITSLYQNYMLEKEVFSLSFTQFYELMILFYAENLKDNGNYLEVPEAFVKGVIKKTGRRKFRAVPDEPLISSNIWFDEPVYQTYLNITYSHMMAFDKVNAPSYSLSFMCYKLIDFIESNFSKFKKFKV